MTNFGPLAAEIYWRVAALLHAKFQLVSRLPFVTPPTPLNGGQQNFAGC